MLFRSLIHSFTHSARPLVGRGAGEGERKELIQRRGRGVAKWSEEALQIAEKRRDVKGKGEKERYTHLNAEFQRIARRDKKAFLSDQCKEIEENNRMGKTRDIFKKIRDTKGIFHPRASSAKTRGFHTQLDEGPETP